MQIYAILFLEYIWQIFNQGPNLCIYTAVLKLETAEGTYRLA